MQTKKNIFLWTLYDFANSIVSIVFFLYFAQWIVIDRGVADIYFNLAFTISALLLLLTAPIAGLLLDRHLRRITGLRYTTILTVLFYGICAFYAITNKEIAALIFFTLGLYAYLLSFTFYTPLLHDVAPTTKRGLISGLGITANYLGQFTGLVIALPFSNGTMQLFNAAPRAETLAPAIAIFFILSLPMLLFFKEPKHDAKRVSFKTELRKLTTETKFLFSSRSVMFFLLSFLLFNDAILTTSNNFPIFLEQVWHVSDAIKTYILLGVLITSAIGGTLSGFIADRCGHKRTLMWLLSGWIVILPLMGLLRHFTLFVIATTLMGFWFGANWTVSRSLMTCVAPKGKHNLAFAYYSLAERAASFVGPIVWGLVVSKLAALGSVRYRIAALVVTGFIILGVFALARVKDDRQHERESITDHLR